MRVINNHFTTMYMIFEIRPLRLHSQTLITELTFHTFIFKTIFLFFVQM